MRPTVLLTLVLGAVAGFASAQDALNEMPRYDRYEKLRREISGSVKYGTATVTWAEDGKSLTYRRDDKNYRLDLATGQESEATATSANGRGGQTRRTPERGRQFDVAFSPDEKRKAFHRDGNVFLSDADGKNEVAITTDGSREKRIKYGVASWVYGEELNVREAMWWSPDGNRVAFYRFDEGPVKDYYLQYEQTKFQDVLDVEAYPKAGTDNPVVGLLVVDVATKKVTPIDTKFGDAALGEYVYDVRWAPDGKGLLFNRTNRKQNEMELCIADPATGKSRAVVRESQPQSWAENHPTVQFLKDNRRFLWESERNGFKNLYLYDLDGKLINPITQHQADVERVVRVDEAKGVAYYMARTGNNPYLSQLHRVGLDGKGDRRLTDPAFHHNVSLAPDGRHFGTTFQNAATPPVTQILTEDGKVVKELAKSDTTKFEALGLKRVERFTYPAADGKTVLYGSLHFPSDFDPAKKYPLVVSVYGGPESGGAPETFSTPNAITEMGFLYASFEGRGTSGRGKAFRDAVYGKLGIVEIDDQAAGVKALAQRPYVNGKRVGIFGTSYGGYASLMALLRHPDVFHAAAASSSVTDWRHYDTIYTERYQGLPWEKENLKGYEAGSALQYVKNLTGKLLLYYGTADNNVHPSNTLQLVEAIERAGKRYDMQVGPDRGHTGVNNTRMWEYFVTHLILRSPKEDTLAMVWKARK
ncbi:MAG: DPP IV N-terminal domain-containing protein [Fimbriimonas sp.]